MTDANVRFYAPDSGEVRTLHIETTGAVVNITVGLVDRDGQPVTRVDVTPDGEARGGDARGRFWNLVHDSAGAVSVVLRPDPRYDDAAEARARAEQSRSGGVKHEYWSLVTTGEADGGDLEHIAGLIEAGNTEGPYRHG